MWWFVAAALAAENPGGCQKTSVGRIMAASEPQPSVVVLGERKGTLPDLARARKIVKKLTKKGPVTLALQAIRADQQDILDRYSRGELTLEALPEALAWETSWGFPFETYAPLLSTVSSGVKLVAIGVPYQRRPPEAALPMPPGYIHVLADPMGDNPVPVEIESKYVEFVAWADHRFAEQAVTAWDGVGTLVILVDRFHVEGGMGVQWQAQRLTDKPVTSAILANGETRCYDGDLLLP